jgi:hypothetical protein
MTLVKINQSPGHRECQTQAYLSGRGLNYTRMPLFGINCDECIRKICEKYFTVNIYFL